MTTTRSIIVGNWKMNGLGAQLDDLRVLSDGLVRLERHGRVVVCPPATLLADAGRVLMKGPVELGAQDCHDEEGGAYTGDISAGMLADAGARLVILGHSERRSRHGETDRIVAAKVTVALRAGLEPIICVGEEIDDRRAGKASAVVSEQLKGSLPDDLAGRQFQLAYEPVWAIGSGVTPSRDEIAEMHGAIRMVLEGRFGSDGARVAILYGGSVKRTNAAEILAIPEVDGALIGGASLVPADFLAIIKSC